MIKWPEQKNAVKKKQSKIHAILVEEGMYTIVVDKDGINNQLYIPSNIITNGGLKVGVDVISYYRGKRIVGISVINGKFSYIMPVQS